LNKGCATLINILRKWKCILVFFFLISIFLGTFAFAERRKSDKKAVKLIQKIMERNNRIRKFEANISIIRQNYDAFKGIFPPMEVGFVQVKGIINYKNKNPRMMQIYLFPDNKGSYYYKFVSVDGYLVKLKGEYRRIFKESSKLGGYSPHGTPSPTPSISPPPLDSATIRPDPRTTHTPEPTPEVGPGESPGIPPPPTAIHLPDATPQVSPAPSHKGSPGIDQSTVFIMPEADKIMEPIKTEKDGALIFSKANPINLLYPFSLKRHDPRSRKYYKGIGKSRGHRCHMVDIESPRYGASRLYISDDEDNYIIQIDRLSPSGEVYASAYFTSFKKFRAGGCLYQSVELFVYRQSLVHGMIGDWDLHKKDLTDLPDISPAGKIDKRPPKKDDRIIILPPVWQFGTVFLVLFLITLLTFFLYRFWFFKRKREPFARSVIIIEGERPEEKLSDILEGMDISAAKFTSERLTEERNRLEPSAKKRPRVVVIGPGMFNQFKEFNFLLKAYIEEGGRAIIFEHGVENTKDMPFTPTFIPYDRSDPNLKFKVTPKWVRIWKKTAKNELKKRTAAFYPYELIAKIEEKDVIVEPIIVATDSKTKINAAAICLLREGRGEYLLVQYRLIEAIRKLKFTASTAEHMVMDLMEYMFGQEKRLEFAPSWIQKLIGLEKIED